MQLVNLPTMKDSVRHATYKAHLLTYYWKSKTYGIRPWSHLCALGGAHGLSVFNCVYYAVYNAMISEVLNSMLGYINLPDILQKIIQVNSCYLSLLCTYVLHLPMQHIVLKMNCIVTGGCLYSWSAFTIDMLRVGTYVRVYATIILKA